MTDDAKPKGQGEASHPAEDMPLATEAPAEAEPGSAGAPLTEAVKLAEATWPLPAGADDWPLVTPDTDVVLPPPPPPPARPSQQMPSPAAAAYEAARIVGEMVDIESVQGAALVAAAAAGAAIEVTRARAASGEQPPLPPPPSGEPASPETTARLQRDRILQAFAEDIANNASAATSRNQILAAPTVRVAPLRRPSQPGLPIPEPRADELPEEVEETVDPVALAAAAIARLRARARTDFAELRVHYQRLDLLVLLAAFVVIFVAGHLHDRLVTPPTEAFDPAGEHGLAFEHPRGWLRLAGGTLPPPRIAHELNPSESVIATIGKLSEKAAAGKDAPYHVELISVTEPTARIEVMVDKKPAWSNIVTGLDLDRRTRWGELYALDDSSVRSVEDHQWLRTAYRYAHAPDKGDVPRIDHAVEYATIDREQQYVLTFFGAPGELDRLEDIVVPTLRVATQTGLPLVPQTGHLSARKYPNAVSRAFESTVMIVVADIIDGRLHARGGGSGVIVGKDGSILTNYHVIHDQRGRLHDVFVIGRFSEQDKAPQLFCAGKPSRSKLQRELDLALLKCDLDLDGRAWTPTSAGAAWLNLPLAKASDVKMGQRIWVLGYPDVGGGGLTLSEGEVEGWSGSDPTASPSGNAADRAQAPLGAGAAGNDFLKTDAAIRHGNSGGPVVDDAGRLVGVASAVRVKQNAAGEVVEVVQAGGRVRPIAAASDLLAIASTGWTPREGRTDVELQPSAVEAPAEGVQIQSRVLDAANEVPVRDALVMVLRPGVSAATVDVNRLDDQVLAYGRSNAQGEVSLRQPVPAPGTYTLLVVARGYEPVVGDGALVLTAQAPEVIDPWGKLLLRAR